MGPAPPSMSVAQVPPRSDEAPRRPGPLGRPARTRRPSRLAKVPMIAFQSLRCSFASLRGSTPCVRCRCALAALCALAVFGWPAPARAVDPARGPHLSTAFYYGARLPEELLAHFDRVVVRAGQHECAAGARHSRAPFRVRERGGGQSQQTLVRRSATKTHSWTKPAVAHRRRRYAISRVAFFSSRSCHRAALRARVSRRVSRHARQLRARDPGSERTRRSCRRPGRARERHSRPPPRPPDSHQSGFRDPSPSRRSSGRTRRRVSLSHLGCGRSLSRGRSRGHPRSSRATAAGPCSVGRSDCRDRLRRQPRSRASQGDRPSDLERGLRPIRRDSQPRRDWGGPPRNRATPDPSPLQESSRRGVSRTARRVRPLGAGSRMAGIRRRLRRRDGAAAGRRPRRPVCGRGRARRGGRRKAGSPPTIDLDSTGRRVAHRVHRRVWLRPGFRRFLHEWGSRRPRRARELRSRFGPARRTSGSRCLPGPMLTSFPRSGSAPVRLGRS